MRFAPVPVPSKTSRAVLAACASLLLGLLAVAAPVQSAAPQNGALPSWLRGGPARPPAGAGPQAWASALGGATGSLGGGRVRASLSALPDGPGLYQLTLDDTGTGWVEQFVVQVPPVAPVQPAPLLVLFHKYGSSEQDYKNTTFFEEAAARGWFAMSRLGASQVSFSSLESQTNTRLAIEFLFSLPTLEIDRQRLYAVGFSMGGGEALNFAARHQDPYGVRIAAVVNHTGSLSLRDIWTSSPAVRWILEFWFGTAPFGADSFRYLRSSSIDVDLQDAVDPTSDLVRNLTHVPVQTWLSTQDVNQALVGQNMALHSHLQSLGGQSELRLVDDCPLPPDCHAWATVDEAEACDFLAAQQLGTPTSGRTLADRDGAWMHFQVDQEVAGQFSPFQWNFDAGSATIAVSATRNVRRLTLDALKSGMPTQNVQLLASMSTADGTGDELAIWPVPNAPLVVMRDGVAVGGSAWSYSSTTRTLVLRESDPNPHIWTVTLP